MLSPLEQMVWEDINKSNENPMPFWELKEVYPYVITSKVRSFWEGKLG